MRVLHVVFSLEAGGMENGIVNVAHALESRGHEIHVCCLAHGGKFVERFPNPERIHILGKGEGISPVAVAKLAGQIRRAAPDVIHTHNFGPLIYTTLAVPGWKSRTIHGEHAELTPQELAPRRMMLRRFLYGRVRRVHTVSEGLKRSLIGQGFQPEKIDVVVNGVDTARFTPGSKAEARTETGLPPDGLVLGLVGRYGEFKRHLELIEAFERLQMEGRDLQLVFIGGGGPMEQAVERRAAKSPFRSRIRLAGFQNDARPWYRALDLLVIPSTNEGLSNALLEAMACGIPALAHTACGSADVITDGVNGFLRDVVTPDSLLGALHAALAAPDILPTLGAAARRTVEAHFSFSSMVDGYEALYRGTTQKIILPSPDLV
jgi:glycosyltransferase involved in cell wall biosynthesis